jgi:hypothetical protein
MGHYAYVGDDFIVKKVIVSNYATIYNMYPNQINTIPGWFKTSYNTKENTHYEEYVNEDYDICLLKSKQEKALRGNYASVGSTYLPDDDIFVPLKPFDSWVLDKDTANWKPPVDIPENIPENDEYFDEEFIKLYIHSYSWSEEDRTWELRSLIKEDLDYFYKWDVDNIEWVKTFL